MTSTTASGQASAQTADTSPGPRPWALRLLLWLLGGWLFLTIAMAFVASANFRVLEPDQLRHADQVYAELSADQRRTDLRYAASEINRYLFTVYSDVHAVIAGLGLVLLFAARLAKKRLILAATGLGVCFVFALIFALWFTPTMVEAGRVIDFMPRDPEPPEVTHFFRLHRINVAMEMIKMLLLAATTAVLLRRP